MGYTTTEGVQGICPSGWHIPTDAEQHTLDDYFATGTCNPARDAWDCDPAGTNLKSGGYSNFNALLAGYRNTVGSFYSQGTYTYFWSSSESGVIAWVRGLYSDDSTVRRNAGDKANGLSVRCLQDEDSGNVVMSRLMLDYIETYSTSYELALPSTTGTADSGSTTTLVDTGAVLTQTGSNAYEGYALTLTSGSNNGETVYVDSSSYNSGSGIVTLNFTPAVGTAVSTETYTLTPDGIKINDRATRGILRPAWRDQDDNILEFDMNGNLPTDIESKAKQGTFSIWLNPDFAYNTDTKDHYVFDSGLQRLYYAGSDDKFHFEIYNGTNWTGATVLSAAQTFSAHDSIHLAATWDADSGLKLTINGVKTTNATTWTEQELSHATKLGIGSEIIDGRSVDSETKLLIHSDTSSGSTTFTDSSNSARTITANGDVVHSANASKFGSTSMYFDGSGDYLSVPDSNDWDFGSGDFTIDFWIKLGTQSS